MFLFFCNSKKKTEKDIDIPNEIHESSAVDSTSDSAKQLFRKKNMRHRTLESLKAALPQAARDSRVEIPPEHFQYLNFSDMKRGDHIRLTLKPLKWKGKACGPRSKVMFVMNVWYLDDGCWELACNT